jgi:transposase
MKRKCSLEEKLAAIALVEQGMSARSVSDKLHLGHHVLFEWLAAYKERGIQGLIPKGKRPRRLSYEEKCKIIGNYIELDPNKRKVQPYSAAFLVFTNMYHSF